MPEETTITITIPTGLIKQQRAKLRRSFKKVAAGFGFGIKSVKVTQPIKRKQTSKP